MISLTVFTSSWDLDCDVACLSRHKLEDDPAYTGRLKQQPRGVENCKKVRADNLDIGAVQQINSNTEHECHVVVASLILPENRAVGNAVGPTCTERCTRGPDHPAAPILHHSPP